MTSSPREPLGYELALTRLRQGNDRFVQNVRCIESMASQSRKDTFLSGQSPMAIVLSCSDSRAPAELVFDCGLGDLFVVRIAGNVVAPSIIGSVEYAASTFNTELVVVMGHTLCGAVSATLDVLTHGSRAMSDNVRDIVERISPAVAELVDVGSGVPCDKATFRKAMRANVRASVSHLRHGSRILEQRVSEGRLLVVGAEYDLETGKVSFFDGVPQSFESSAPKALDATA